jgi:hypothetical protein
MPAGQGCCEAGLGRRRAGYRGPSEVQPRRHRAIGGSRGRRVTRGGEAHAALGMEGGSMPLAPGRDIMLA